MDCDPAGDLHLPRGITIPESALRFTFSRSSGPGGQNVNKLSTKVQLHAPLSLLRERIGAAAAARLLALAGPARLTDAGEVTLTADDTRSQRMNRATSLKRLRVLLLEAMTPPRPRHRTKPTAGSRRRRLEAKIRRSQTKERRRPPGDAA